jgi:hypothetical protein
VRHWQVIARNLDEKARWRLGLRSAVIQRVNATFGEQLHPVNLGLTPFAEPCQHPARAKLFRRLPKELHLTRFPQGKP